MTSKTIGSVKGVPVSWDSRTGLVQVKLSGMFTSTWYTLPVRCFTTQAVFDMAEEYLRRRRR